MKVHFIAIGGSAMHNLAIALSRKGFLVTGSDDEIFEPSKGRLKKEGILPEQIGWNTDFIHADLDAVILGMHAREDNPELAKAKELGLEIFSYPEYIYEQSKNKKRVVIGGSHGKTTITSMILHALQVLDFPVDYMVGAQLEGYDCMVKLTEENDVIILEGDEYLSSPLDRRPKFHLYKPHVALISGIAWDHINVFPTYDNYVEQFNIFCNVIEDEGVLVYNEEDFDTKTVASKQAGRLKTVPYSTPRYEVNTEGTSYFYENNKFPLKIFGAHNLQNLCGAMNVVEALGISPTEFLNAMKDFTGAGKRLEKIRESADRIVYKDFAHSPSKLKATTSAVKEQYPDRKLVACMELHTFSSLKKDFLPQYKDAMKMADKALVYFSPKVVEHKKLDPISKDDVFDAFGKNVVVETETQKVLDFIENESNEAMVLLMMSSGNFDGVDYNSL
ncbi:UDP-N-acetylmuramate--L-alanine ligase [Brumimicrobium oceani]|uniref:Peptidoglycan synthetase n=1 Tax=Brumimicrobium oceani TaxID=2100725 RepID=A0A2U2XGU5_9FLAO|nr:Mur ligase family protein [Brumimicrobium oceani]PWH87014.1 peptidoglycan synthetase [Brumimicrobium oceani]